MTEPLLGVEEAVTLVRSAATEDVAVLTMSAIAYWSDARPQHFRLLGAMGAAASIGLGIAIGAPDRRVWVIDGDGSLLMQLAVVSAVADAAPANLVHVVVDNGVYAVSGAQPTPAPRDWAGLLQAAGYAYSESCETTEEIRRALYRDVRGPRGIVLRCRRERPDYPDGFLAFSPSEEAARLRGFLTGPA
jgi:phosphonopyruvate decarboxylase